jgi:hypothetical protein
MAMRIGAVITLVPSRGVIGMIGRDRPSLRARVMIVAVMVVALGGGARGDEQQEPAVLKAVGFLKARSGGKPIGESAMIGLGLLKAEVPANDPAIQACLTRVKSAFGSSVFSPSMRDGRGVYEATASILALSAEDPVANKSLIGIAAEYLISSQKANGSWDYTQPNREQGDTSISQYAVLGLWEAKNCGVTVPQSLWDRAAKWFLSSQDSTGGWSYHRDQPAESANTVAMTAAGVGSLLICQRYLDPKRRNAAQGVKSSLLVPLAAPPDKVEAAPILASTSASEVRASIARGMGWIGSYFTMGSYTAGKSTTYMLYGVERIGALADKQTIGRLDWYERGRAYLRSTQNPDGAWRNGQFGDEMNTVWGVLFLVKSTAKTLRRIEVKGIGAGTLLGGRGLPKDLSSMTVAGGRVVSRPMNGAIEGMLAVIEDPRAEQAEAAVAGLVERYYSEGSAALRPHKTRFKKMLADPDPGVRKVAAWALARTGDLDVVPALIDAMASKNEDDASVVSAVKLGLQLVSRKVDDLGPANASSKDERLAAADRWRAWYSSIRPIADDGQDGADGDAAPDVRPAEAGKPAGSDPK